MTKSEKILIAEVIPYYSLLWYLTSNQNILICTTHIKKVIAKLYSLTLRRKMTERQQQVRNFAEVRNFA